MAPAARDSSVVVVGAGIGGLAAAIDLAVAGMHVTVVEGGTHPGGKARTVPLGDDEVDAGPTVLTMRWVFDELFAAAGRSLDGEVALQRLSVIARHRWPDGRSLDLLDDAESSASAISDVFGAREADGYLRFLRDARRIYETVEQPFLRAQRPTVGDLFSQMGRLGLKGLASIDAARTMWRAIGSYFRSPQLRQLFGRYATYVGTSPFEAPATLDLIAYVESAGVWRVRRGVSELARALERVARTLGVSFLYDARVARVTLGPGALRRVHFARRDAIVAGAVVITADASAVATGLLGDEIRTAGRLMKRSERSFSAVTLALRGEASGPPMSHHNVFFSDDTRAEFQALAEGRFPPTPTVYLCAQHERIEREPRTAHPRWLLVTNAPANGDERDRWEGSEVEQCVEATFRTLERCGVTMRPSLSLTTTPREFESRFPGTGGALYGPASRGALSGISRAGARTKIPGVYLAGGSVHPGPGVPMAALSGRLAAAALLADLSSTARSRRAGTSGSTSTV